MENLLKKNNVSTKTHVYPYDYGISYLHRGAFSEWVCNAARLDLVAPTAKVLANFDSDATSIFQRSFGFKSDTPLDIVLLDKGNKEESYHNIDIKGKLIFVRDNPLAYVPWAIEKYGALGIITDFVLEGPTRTRNDMYDVTRYTAFWYTEEPKSKPFGFVLTPREGDNLFKICKEVYPDYPKVTCNIDANFYPGSIEVVEGEIKGTTDEEIWIVSHLCHPKTCANDNSSGVSATVEAISVLQTLINEGKLPPLKRTLKVLFMPEFSGTLPFVEDYINNKTQTSATCLAALNMDMVGGRQDYGYGPLNITDLPCSTPSFVAHLASIIMEEVNKEGESLNKDTSPMFNTARTRFSVGSDHVILSDPAIGVPTPMLGQWPDMFYHTSGDDLSVISPRLMAKSATIAAAYAYKLCNLEDSDIKPILDENIKAFVKANTEANLSGLNLSDALDINLNFYKSCVEDLTRFLPRSVEDKVAVHAQLLQEIAESFKKANNITLENEAVESKDLDQKDKNKEIPIRTSNAVIFDFNEHAKTDKQKELLKDYNKNWAISNMGFQTGHYIIQFLIDGKRTVDEIAKMALFQNREGSIEGNVKFLYLYRELGFCKF